jgi:hypothetical protein
LAAGQRRAAGTGGVLSDFGQAHQVRTFDQYLQYGDRSLLHKLTLYDEIRHNSHSVLEYNGAAPHNLPDKLFNQSRTDRF